MRRLHGRRTGSIGTLLVTVACMLGAATVAPASAAAETIPPTITITTPAEGQHFELNAAITAAYSCDDTGGSGVATCAATGPVSTYPAGPHTFTVNATDFDGNPASRTVNFVVDPDTTAPTISITSPVDGQHYALGSAIDTTYTCDDAGGSDVATCVASTAIDTSVGTHAYTVNATDGAGNPASKTVHYTVDPDTTAPTITITSPGDGQHYALGTAINVAYVCTDDGGSDVATCVASTQIDYTVGTHAYTVNATDGAGNPASKTVHYTVDPDSTPPTITITSPGAGQHYPFGTVFGGAFACDDVGGSGVATCAASTAIDLGVGTHVFTVNATDGAGNPASKSVTYVVDPAPSDPGTSGGDTSTGGGGTSTTTDTSTGDGTSTAGGTTADEVGVTINATPRVTVPARATTLALARGVTLSLSGLKPHSRVVLRVRRGLRTIKIITATANSAGKATFKIRLSRLQLRTLRGKTLTLRFTTTAANGKRKVVTKKLRVT